MKFYEKLSDASSSASSSAHTSPQGSRSMSPKVGDEGREDGGGFQLRKEREGDWVGRGGGGGGGGGRRRKVLCFQAVVCQ